MKGNLWDQGRTLLVLARTNIPLNHETDWLLSCRSSLAVVATWILQGHQIPKHLEIEPGLISPVRTLRYATVRHYYGDRDRARLGGARRLTHQTQIMMQGSKLAVVH